MTRRSRWLQKFRFSAIIIASYTIAITSGWYLLQPSSASEQTVRAITKKVMKKAPEAPKVTIISGKPVHIVIPAAAIDLPVVDGNYNEADGSWTLNDTVAQFATISTPANNTSGNTFIYGHGTDPVFARLAASPLATGAQALIYTDNGRVFSYLFQSKRDLTPDDTTVFDYEGPSILTVQTCTGMFSEWRTLYQFNFEKVVQ